ncbi:S1C family serine protease [Streptomyces boluensis]|uniref:Trypsin-like serine protease n=1 Tax=Streptomyces boluensis TaxID=1775135 RepID=A0A964UKQ4_9ACTN|nr:trypsin-like peptidase domain-containing protein [Streptomyces boluensis]NBE50326.1 trypsin-like serine protease [Streptomyces boluensis]
MTESFRRSGDHPEQQHSEQYPSYAGPYSDPYGTYPPPPPYAPAQHAAPRRAKGPVALLAAVALGAAAVGGGTAFAAQELWGKTASASTGVNGTNAAAGSKGSVSGVANAVSDSIVEIQADTASGQSTGSGVIIASDGEIVTNNHVVSGASTVKVRTNDGKSYTAEVVGTDSAKDLALIKLRGASGLKAATLGDSEQVNVGDQVVAIGSPEGLTGTVTSGIVSAKDRDVTVSRDGGQDQEQGGQGQDGGGQWPFEFEGRQFNGDTGSSKTTYKALQTDASLNPGNSGGALIDMNGRIIGINSAMYAPSSGSGSSSGSVGLGFAIPVDTVKADLAKLRAGSTD